MKTVVSLLAVSVLAVSCSIVDPDESNLERGSFKLNFTAKQNYSWGINQDFDLPKKENLFEFDRFVIIYEDPDRDGTFDWHLLVIGREFARPEPLNPNLAPLDDNKYNEHATIVRMSTSKTPSDSTVNATYFYRTPNGNYGRLREEASYGFLVLMAIRWVLMLTPSLVTKY